MLCIGPHIAAATLREKQMTITSPAEPLAVRPRDAAKLLSISERTLWAMTKRGDLPAIRVGTGRRRAVLYSVAQLREWLSHRATGGAGNDRA